MVEEGGTAGAEEEPSPTFSDPNAVEQRLAELEARLNVMEDVLPLGQLAYDPANPPSDNWRLFAKDSWLYALDSAGIRHNLLVRTGAGTPTHTDHEGAQYWDTTNKLLYTNTDGGTTWAVLLSGTLDHGALAGRDDNDHGAIYYTEAEVDALLHASSHTLASHSSKLHSALSDAPTNAHHNAAHTAAFHSDQGATGSELEELTDGSETLLHTHASSGGGGGAMISPASISTVSIYSLGLEMLDLMAPTATAGFTANDAVFIPIIIPEDVTVKRLWCLNGSTVSGNIDIGLYDESLTKLVSSGSTPQSGSNAVQFFNVTDTAVTAGIHYLAVAVSSSSADFQGWSITRETLFGAFGCFTDVSAFPLPASPSKDDLSDKIPLLGLLLTA